MIAFYNQNQILAVQLIPQNRIQWKIGGNLFPFSQVFHAKDIQQKRVTIAYAKTVGGTLKYFSLGDDREVQSFDALVNLSDYSQGGASFEVPIPLILDCEDITFKSTADKQVSGVLYTNKLEYSLPKVTDVGNGTTEMQKLEQQLELLQSGKAFHLLLQLASCGDAHSIVLCPEDGAFGVSVDDTVKNTKITITIKNLTAHQFLK